MNTIFLNLKTLMCCLFVFLLEFIFKFFPFNRPHYVDLQDQQIDTFLTVFTVIQ